MPFSGFIVTDDLTILLGLVATALFLLHNLYKPQPLVHPILLGRQSDVARVRNPNESAVYRNYSTGMLGRFPLRPTKDVQTVLDILRPELDAPRTLWSTKITNSELLKRINSVATGLMRLAKLSPGESNVLLLLNDGLEFLIMDLALASRSIPSFTITSLSLLSTVLESHPPSAIVVQVEFLPQLLELIYDASEQGHHTVIVVGEQSRDKDYSKLGKSVNFVKFDDIEREGSNAQFEPPSEIDSRAVFTVSFSEVSNQGRAVLLNHQNFTAGIAAVRSLLPVSSALSPLDTIISAHSLNTPYGRSIAYTAIFEGTSFATLQSTRLLNVGDRSPDPLTDVYSVKSYSTPSPTIFFVNPSHLTAITSSILDEARKRYFPHALGWRHKLAGVAEGFITKESLWDRLVFDNARIKILGEGAGTLRAVVVADGSLSSSVLTPARIALSVPLVNAAIHSLVAGPILASHPFDLQNFFSLANGDSFSAVAPVGPPSINLEVKLIGVDDTSVENGGDPVGMLSVRGPPVGRLFGMSETTESDEGEWVSIGLKAKVMTNGTFKIAPSGTVKE